MKKEHRTEVMEGIGPNKRTFSAKEDLEHEGSLFIITVLIEWD